MCKEFPLQWLPILALSLAFTGCNSSTTPPPPTASALWITTQNDQVMSYTVDHASGSISPVGNGGNPAPTDQGPAAVAVSPDRLSLFVANKVKNTVSVYTVALDGTLTSANIPEVQTGTAPVAMAVDAKYNLLFVANQGSDSITVFSITPGLLTLKSSFPIQSPPLSSGNGPSALAISPASFSCSELPTGTVIPVPQTCFALYAANQTSGTITAYEYFVDASGNFFVGATNSSGVFTVGAPVPGSPYKVGIFPMALAFARCAGAGANSAIPCQSAGANGLFVANQQSNDLTVFSACIQLPTCQFGESSPDGSLNPVLASVPAGTSPSALLMDPSANFLYVVNSCTKVMTPPACDPGTNQISTFSYTDSVQTLTPGSIISAPGGSEFLGGAFLPVFSNELNARNWLVIWGAKTLAAYGTGAGGSLTAATPAQFSGQPTAIVIR